MSYIPTFSASQDMTGGSDRPGSRGLEDPSYGMRDALEQHITAGDSSVRDRDAYDPALSELRQASRPATKPVNEDPYNVWPDARHKGYRPINYEPNGTFETLLDNNKLRPEGEGARAIGAGEHVSNKKFYIPGYTGFVRGSQHVSGRTFGAATRRALDTDYRENVCTSPIPSDPHKNMKIEHFQPRDTFISHTFAGKQYHVPGYTGFVPGVRNTYSKTYGTATSGELYTNSLQHPRAPAREKEGHAHAHKTRQMLVVDSAPLPGGTRVPKAPEKLVPTHLQHLQFFAM